METIIRPTEEDVSKLAARIVAMAIRMKPNLVLGLPTGSTPLGMYQELVRMHREEKLDFSGVTTFNLDEYVGLNPDHPCSYNSFMYKNFFNFINIKPHNIYIPDGMTRDIPKYCADYERRIREAGGIDIQVLGIGTDGHIGFNEPTSSLASRTRIKTLTEQSMKDNARFFSTREEVPKHCITMGVATILEARECLLIAAGIGKSKAIAAMVEGPVSAMVPASILQMHQKVRVIIDEAASSKLTQKQYYKTTYDDKPDWQQD